MTLQHFYHSSTGSGHDVDPPLRKVLEHSGFAEVTMCFWVRTEKPLVRLVPDCAVRQDYLHPVVHPRLLRVGLLVNVAAGATCCTQLLSLRREQTFENILKSAPLLYISFKQIVAIFSALV